MPFDYNEDFMPRKAPKPAPLIEVAATPLVPEVSLLLDQDRNKSIHLKSSASINHAEGKSKRAAVEGQKEVPLGNQYESYNTWKSRNAELLSAITGSSAVPEPAKRYSNLRMCNEQQTQSNDKEVHYSEEVRYLGTLPIARQVPSANRINKPELECLGVSMNFGHHPVKNIDQQHINNPPSIPVCYAPPVNNYTQPRNREIINPHQLQYPSVSHDQTNSCTVTSNDHLPVEKQFPNVGLHGNTQCDSKAQQNVAFLPHSQVHPGYNTVQGNLTQVQCQCMQGQCEVVSNNRIQQMNPQSCVSNRDSSKTVHGRYPKLVSPLDIAHVNNQAIIDLYHIINLQSEQISILQQQVKQVLQIHLDCDKSEKQNFNCRGCHCDQKSNCVSEKASCSNAQRDNDSITKSDKFPNNKTENNEISKRSIGIMTSSVEKTEQTLSNVATQSEKLPPIKERRKKKQDKKSNPPPAPPYNYPSRQNQRDVMEKEVGKRNKSYPKTGKKPKPLEIIQVDNSFSLNEAELVIRNEQDDLSPNTSVHVDLQDYFSSSVESGSDATASSSSGSDDEQDLETGDDSTEPQIGWTFYNRVVGQVNNILKKTPTPSRQEHPQMFKASAGHMYGLNADLETENNWSKRVTFDGPPLEDSENNSPNFGEPLKFDQPIPHQDMRMKDGHGRMQDFMMYNFANGNANLSFGTLRYLDRYHMLPSQRKTKPQEQMYQQAYQRNNKKYTKKKTRNFENISGFPPHVDKRKSTTPSSRVLDITALKQQPKLF